VADPNWQATRAETINAPAPAVWPWLMQLGYGRGGYYGDLGLAASADQILPELQHLDVDDVLLDGANCDATAAPGPSARSSQSGRWCCSPPECWTAGRSTPRAKPKPPAFFDCSWAFVLVPEGEQVTRLLVRSRIRMVPAWALHGAGFLLLGDTVMQRAMLRGIKQRVERQRRRLTLVSRQLLMRRPMDLRVGGHWAHGRGRRHHQTADQRSA
jgi:hypothetical protein